MLEQVMESIANTDSVVAVQRTDSSGFVEIEINFFPTILSSHAECYELGNEDFSIYLPKQIKNLTLLDVNEVEIEYETYSYWMVF